MTAFWPHSGHRRHKCSSYAFPFFVTRSGLRNSIRCWNAKTNSDNKWESGQKDQKKKRNGAEAIKRACDPNRESRRVSIWLGRPVVHTANRTLPMGRIAGNSPLSYAQYSFKD